MNDAADLVEEGEEDVSLTNAPPKTEDSVALVESADEEKERKLEKMRKWGRAFYGEQFERYTKVAEMEPYLPAFRDYYVAERTTNPKGAVFDIIVAFNKTIFPAIFYPRAQQYQYWRRRWDSEMLQQKGIMVEARKVAQVMKTKSEAGLHAPMEEELEMGMRYLGGELVNDAVDMLHRDQEAPELYEPDELIKRRSYVVNVFAYVTKAVQGKEALKLKKSAEARETAGFLMELMQQGTAGKLDADTINLMRGTVSPVLPHAVQQ